MSMIQWPLCFAVVYDRRFFFSSANAPSNYTTTIADASIIVPKYSSIKTGIQL